MTVAAPTTIYRKDYLPPAYFIETTELDFQLFEEGALVRSALRLRRNPQRQEHELQLDGVDLELRRLAIDGRELSAEEYELAPGKLTLRNLPETFTLECDTWIKPQENFCLEGLYKSSGMFCTQCEAEGFRRITYYLDRPDVMSRFRTRIEAEKSRYPILLSNGNEIERGDLDNGRHYVVWEDPFKKPSYLFALVAGDLMWQDDHFITQDGRKVLLRIFVEPANIDKCQHALESLKKSMRWDEEVYGRVYDLDIFMIVAVNDFNMGAMENKGLNIFNSSCVLAKPETATDGAYQRIESIVAHEYFHNWSGNRVTCRDWFQLSLKEGFTVFRDAEFSADMGSRTVKRIEDVNLLRTAQFAEDAGPMAHPVRPDSYMEISNFYTLTIYEKGAEVVRMLHTLLGPELFRKGSDLYFDRHDGCAVTCDDFVQAMADVSGLDLEQFKLWYSQAGTPIVEASDCYDAASQTYHLTLRQSSLPSPGQPTKQPYHIPVAVGLLDGSGQDIPLALDTDVDGQASGQPTRVLELREAEQTFVFKGIAEQPVPSLLRSFSAPVRLRYGYDRDQLMFLMRYDSDGFNRWDAGQKLALDVIQEQIGRVQAQQPLELDSRLVEAYRGLLRSQDDQDKAVLAKMLELPSVSYLVEQAEPVDLDAILQARDFVRVQLAQALRDEWKELYRANHETGPYSGSFEAMAKRALKNACLSYLLVAEDQDGLAFGLSQFEQANNMTDESAAFAAIVHSNFADARTQVISRFYEKWQQDPLVVDQWFSVQACSREGGSLARIRELREHPAFNLRNPNKVRALVGTFAGQNWTHFHSRDGAGYRFLADQVLELDPLNPQIASRLLTPLTRWRKFDSARGQLMRAELERIRGSANLSRDVSEIVLKSLAD